MKYLNEFLRKMEAIFREIERETNGLEQPTFRKFETPWGQGYYYSNMSYNPLAFDGFQGNSSTEKTISVGDRIKQLEQELKVLVAKEDYLNAAKVRDALKDLKENYNTYESKLKDLLEKKKIAVQAEDYEAADKFKKEIEELAATTDLKQLE